MKIKSEWELLKKIKNTIKLPDAGLDKNLLTAMGDDCAVYKINDGRYALFTTDISIESKHFIIETTTPKNIGFKSMMGNLSDIAAMGGFPKLAFVSLGVPDFINEKFILSLYRGFNEACADSKTAIAGGDTSKSENLIINIFIYGETSNIKPVLRSGAKTGDTIYLTGKTGDSKAGLEILLSGDKKFNGKYKQLVRKHQRPECRLRLVEYILKKFSPSSMIDISDGLLSDLWQVCRSSNRGFILDKKKIPLSGELQKYSNDKNISPYDFALNSGEEYELLFTSSKKNKNELNIETKNIEITPIGQITGKGYLLNHGDKIDEIKIKGFDHFEQV